LKAVFGLAVLLGVAAGAPADDDEYRDSRDRGGSSGSGGDPKNAFNIMMNYELGMHCTGFEFAYCCVLPPYNSILAQVVKTQQSEKGEGAFAKLLEGDPNEGLDALGRQTVLRDADLDRSGNFQKYVLEYWHEAQPRDPAPKVVPQTSRLISAVEGNSLLMWNTLADSAAVNTDGSLKLSTEAEPWNGVVGAMLGNGDYSDPDPKKHEPDFSDPTDNYWNAVWNHLYIYDGLEGARLCAAGTVGDSCHHDADCDSSPNAGDGVCGSTAEGDKIRLGVAGHIEFPDDCGAGLHPMGPDTQDGLPTNPVTANDCATKIGGADIVPSNGNVLTFSGEEGTVVYTQMKVLDNLPITLTSPRIWEALGLPLTPFEDSIDFFANPGAMFEESVRPFVAMNARLRRFDPTVPGGMGDPVLQNGHPVEGFGTAPIDIPNCERCHSNESGTNSPHNKNPDVWSKVKQEYDFWMAYYNIQSTESDWYPRLKSAAISILGLHDKKHGTQFLAQYPKCSTPAECDALAADLSADNGRPVFAQSTRIGDTSVLCQRCHADNVIAQVKSASKDGKVIKPISEAIHRAHRGTGEGGPIAFTDSFGRFGGCQGCHPAHRSNGDMTGYPITETGDNFYAASDNRLGSGGCFVGRDVHSNPFKDVDGAETPEHLNAIGDWLVQNVARNQNQFDGDRDMRGLWCTNCHNQLSQEIWKQENMVDLVHDVPGPDAENIRALSSLADIANAVGVSTQQAIDWLDPRDPNVNCDENGDCDGPIDGAWRMAEETMGIWREDPGLCAYLGGSTDPAIDANVATIEVAGSAGDCTTGAAADGPDCDGNGSADFQLCGTFDGDGDFSVNILDFCTTPDCVADAQATLTSSNAAPVPFSAATDGRDHWLAAGEPHCADCHEAPYVEQSGNINAFAPFNYPRKAGLMRYSRGHRDITCQGCHESIHGLYPVAPSLEDGPGIGGVDTTSYAQAASMNSDGSHGPLKCGACHRVNGAGVHSRMDDLVYDGQRVRGNLDAAIGWAHTFTDEHSPVNDMCVNCHEDEADEVRIRDDEWQAHAMKGRASRKMMDQVEMELLGAIAGTNPDGSLNQSIARNGLCQACHGDEWREVGCRGEDGVKWKEHLSEGRVSPVVWEQVTKLRTNGSTCGW
jgi:hypothetical protein